MIMGTAIQCLGRDYFIAKASEKARELFGNAPVISVKYYRTYALACYQGNDGVKRHAMIDYGDFIPEGQFGLVMRNLHLKDC